MRNKLFPTLLLLLSGTICAHGQTDAQPEAQPEKISVVLKDARPLVVEEIFESREGYWYKRGNVTTFLDRERVVRIDYPNPLEAAPASGPVQGNVKWRLADAAKIQDFLQPGSNENCRRRRLANLLCTRVGAWTIATAWTSGYIPTALKAGR